VKIVAIVIARLKQFINILYLKTLEKVKYVVISEVHKKLTKILTTLQKNRNSKL